MTIEIDALHELCLLTAELTRIRQKECGHLAVENFAPECLGKLINKYVCATAPPYLIDPGKFRMRLGL